MERGDSNCVVNAKKKKKKNGRKLGKQGRIDAIMVYGLVIHLKISSYILYTRYTKNIE